MGEWERRELGTTRGECASCKQEADLTLRESGRRRRLRDRFSTTFDARRDRRVTCSVCRQSYPVGSLALAERPPATRTTRRKGDQPG